MTIALSVTNVLTHVTHVLGVILIGDIRMRNALNIRRVAATTNTAPKIRLMTIALSVKYVPTNIKVPH